MWIFAISASEERLPPCCRAHWDFLSTSKKLLSGKVITLDVGGVGGWGGVDSGKSRSGRQRLHKTEVGRQVCFSDWFVWDTETVAAARNFLQREKLSLVKNCTNVKVSAQLVMMGIVTNNLSKLIITIIFQIGFSFFPLKRAKRKNILPQLAKYWNSLTPHPPLNSCIYLAWVLRFFFPPCSSIFSSCRHCCRCRVPLQPLVLPNGCVFPLLLRVHFKPRRSIQSGLIHITRPQNSLPTVPATLARNKSLSGMN